jgi:hypothetical protein
MAQRDAGSPINISVKERKVAVSFHLDSELKVKVVRKSLSLLVSCGQMMKVLST